MITAAHEYFKAAIPEPYQILGVRLKPLSLHHCLLMQRFSVAFVESGEASAGREDLVMGVLICSKRWEEGAFEDYIFTDECKADVTKWGEEIGEFDVLEKVKLFAEYISKHSKEPGFWKLNGSDEVSGSHWSQCVLLTLTGHLGYTRQEALHCPLSQALSDYFRYAETTGAVRLMSSDEIEMVRAAEKEVA